MNLKKIIIVEDNKKNLELFKAVLGMIPNLEILTKENGIDGLELIKSEDPDIILLDIQLPGINGTEICEEIRKMDKFKSTPIIAVTSFAMKGDKERIVDSGFSDYISKPLNIIEFRKKIQRLLEIEITSITS
ncbi:response regulator [Promethearchaeum syntrophicum]|uniref:Response regulator n=1 Tax=Promethearchaeum syntrophicum TaxID=2594042 RepID=A0A5B9DBQ6_9ARCH|nr:response regulator [Candidatus Prometheoarchaeum syntrophicum]QEE16618.1 hybrid sensory histidine kinase BarA [Candidatus Prometheoarchaeum syntrophicum]